MEKQEKQEKQKQQKRESEWNGYLDEDEKNRIRWGEECPDCGETDLEKIQDNGLTRFEDLTFLCTSCTVQWDANDERWAS